MAHQSNNQGNTIVNQVPQLLLYQVQSMYNMHWKGQIKKEYMVLWMDSKQTSYIVDASTCVFDIGSVY